MLARSILGGTWGLRHHPHLGSHQGQVGHRGCQEQLELGLDPANIARLADPQLYQTRQTMLGHLSPLAVFGKVLTLLEGPGLLQEHFLGMEGYGASLTLPAGNTLVS